MFPVNAALTATRVCHCNGEWGQVHCRPSLQLVQESTQHLVWKLCRALSHCIFCSSAPTTTKRYQHHSATGPSCESRERASQLNTGGNRDIHITGIAII